MIFAVSVDGPGVDDRVPLCDRHLDPVRNVGGRPTVCPYQHVGRPLGAAGGDHGRRLEPVGETGTQGEAVRCGGRRRQGGLVATANEHEAAGYSDDSGKRLPSGQQSGFRYHPTEGNGSFRTVFWGTLVAWMTGTTRHRRPRCS